MNSILSVFSDLPQSHIVATCITLIIVGVLLYLQLINNWSFSKKSIYAFILIPFAIEIVFQCFALIDGTWSFESSLPLEFSYITSLSAITYLFFNHEKINGWFYFAGIWSATAAFLNTIMFGTEPWYIFLRYYGHHGILLFFGLRSLFWSFRPKLNDYLRSIVLTTLILSFVHIINSLIGTNYMFTYSKPNGANFSQLMPEWPDYLILILSLGVFYYTVLYFLGKKSSIIKS
ncbi:MAG: TIGR02206 family membrane protein [Candidatus Marinimicrobia bacterium]|nr:TIGR02206 family membrane protein [Candidatus Neomarinimicrobiota bacterium]MBT4784151.1 TIGR02206 family membrane protein [Candidatus Neomarinimicrobiota bacterium]MBT7524314.1 TIGR02206 family membrane protein [Candidatus Neomarinimicrobiota bacterium]MDC1032273.1 TIGR02206 family membrane protein [Candidatus Neomarinimicrobiota bacterium]